MADSTRDNESLTEVVPAVLGKYLLEQIRDLKEYYPEFPAANRTMRMPSVSIIAAAPEFKPKANVTALSTGTIVSSKAEVKYVVGDYDTRIQLDIWARNKEERDDLFDAVFNALNPKISPMGVTLTMDDYYGSLCDYLYVGHDFADSEQRSQTDEWRATLDVLATCNAIRTRKEFIIETTQTPAEIEGAGQIDETVVVE